MWRGALPVRCRNLYVLAHRITRALVCSPDTLRSLPQDHTEDDEGPNQELAAAFPSDQSSVELAL